MKIFPIITIAFTTFYVVNAVPQEAYGAAPPNSQTPAEAPTDPTFSEFPPVNKVPDVTDPQVQAWLKEIDLSNVPDLPISNGGKVNPTEAQCDPPTVILP